MRVKREALSNTNEPEISKRAKPAEVVHTVRYDDYNERQQTG
jgi:hypothetical protein